MIDAAIASRVLEVVDAGLVSGLGEPEPGKMCVEAAVCFAMGLPHGDEPSCVSPALRQFKIGLNDASWSNSQTRAAGLRRLAVAQLGSAGALNDVVFVTRLAALAKTWAAARAATEAAAWVTEAVTEAARAATEAAAWVTEAARAATEAAAWVTEAVTEAAAWAAWAAAEAATEAAQAAEAATEAADKVLVKCAEDVVQLLIELKAPGCAYLYLTE